MRWACWFALRNWSSYLVPVSPRQTIKNCRREPFEFLSWRKFWAANIQKRPMVHWWVKPLTDGVGDLIFTSIKLVTTTASVWKTAICRPALKRNGSRYAICFYFCNAISLGAVKMLADTFFIRHRFWQFMAFLFSLIDAEYISGMHRLNLIYLPD